VRFWSNFIGCQSDAELSTSWLFWYSSRCRTKPRRTWRANVSSSPTTRWSRSSSFCQRKRLHRPEDHVLDWGQKQRVDYKLATLVYKSLLGQAPSYLVDDCQLIADSGRPPASLRSRQRPHCFENKHSTWRQEFLGRRSENLEQATRLTAAAWHWIWTL